MALPYNPSVTPVRTFAPQLQAPVMPAQPMMQPKPMAAPVMPAYRPTMQPNGAPMPQWPGARMQSQQFARPQGFASNPFAPRTPQY